jgi:hypothetical protein
VDAIPDSEVPVAISFLAELADEEIIELDQALAEPGDSVPLEEVRKIWWREL